MAESHFEPYIYLIEVTDRSVAIGWGGFFFWIKDRNNIDGKDWKLVDDEDLNKVFPTRKSSIGSKSMPYDQNKGNKVEVFDKDGNLVSIGVSQGINHCWISGLSPDTEYTYKVFINGLEWATKELRDWQVKDNFQGLVKSGRKYENKFRTRPSVEKPTDLTFAILGDYGRGIFSKSSKENRQREVAQVLEKAVNTTDDPIRFIITTGDNIYNESSNLDGSGAEDDDWFFSFYQPYRYIINSIPVYPSCGNHDDGETEATDDREQLYDNFYIKERFSGLQGLASIQSGLFYRIRYGSNIELICLDSSKQRLLFASRYFERSENQAFLDAVFPKQVAENAAIWRIPFCHHPPYCAGPQHGNTESLTEKVVEKYCQRSGVKVFLSGHEHNFQHSLVDGINFFISGGGGSVRTGEPTEFQSAHTNAWGGNKEGHFSLVKIVGNTMELTPIGENGEPLPLKKPNGTPHSSTFKITL